MILGTVPVSAYSGGQSITVCNLTINVVGTYNDNGLSRWISNFNVAYAASGCHAQTLLDLFPTSKGFNIFGFTFAMSASLVDPQGIDHCSCRIPISIPALQTAYGFSGSITAANVPTGSYTLVITSPFPFNSGSGQTTYSQQVTVSSS